MGSSFGGVLFPLILQSLLPQIGWAWSIRVLRLILFLLCGIGVALCRSRVPPRNGTATTWRDTLPSTRIFFDGTGAMTVTTIGDVLTDLAYFIPVTYVPSYYIARQNLLSNSVLTGEATFAYQLLAILNVSSFFGRLVAIVVNNQANPS
jgi:MFS family permease